LVENNLINIDGDLFESKENKTELVNKLLHIWKSDPINNLKILLKRIEENVIDMDTKDQKVMNQYFTSSVGDEKVNIQVKFDEESEEALSSGKEIIKQDGGSKENEVADNDTDISLTKDVLPFIIPLICILTMNTEHKDILEMLSVIKSSPSLLCVFEDQSFIWWNKPDIIKLIEVIIGKHIKKDSCIYNISIQFKMSLQSLIDHPKELLELIDNCLKPKQKEKQENGEVFTPMSIVNDMLDKLDNHYIKSYGKSIFTEVDFKWFDPASGMGNFPVAVYLRLMEGLKQVIPIETDRKKHILQKMLYMSELNQKNVFICNQIFNTSNDYKMNLYRGDTLEMDIETVWGLKEKSFDVVLGNPPYNKGGIRSHTGKQLGEKNETIWTKFIEKSFKWLKPNGFLVFINPLSWLKKSHSLHSIMLEKHIVWLKIWDNIKSLATINGKIPISLYILQNTKNDTNKATEIVSEIQSRKTTTSSNEYLNPIYTIPLAFHSIFNKLINFIETKNCKLEYNTKTVKSTGIKTRIPSEYTKEGMWAVDTYTVKDGIMVKKVTDKHPDKEKRKLIISNKASFTGAFIDEGKLSLTSNHKF
jgi:16S rRNA G966 N2-methylase RsmD